MFEIASRGSVGGASGASEVWDEKGVTLSARVRLWIRQAVSCLENDDDEEVDVHCIWADPRSWGLIITAGQDKDIPIDARLRF